MDEIKLKPCPFCGRIPMVEDCGDNRYFVRCKCGIAQDKLYGQRCDAVRRWNTRKQSAQPEQPPYVAEIEAEYQKAVKMPHIHKPLAKALYEVWKKHDREDAERRTDG